MPAHESAIGGPDLGNFADCRMQEEIGDMYFVKLIRGGIIVQCGLGIRYR